MYRPKMKCEVPVKFTVMWASNMYLLYFQGVGRRYANLVCKKADVDMKKRAGELTDDEVTCMI